MVKIKKILKIIFMAGIFGLTYSFFFSTYENIKVNKKVNDFKKRAVHIVEYDTYISGSVSYYRKYMEVPRETKAELNDTTNVFYDYNKTMLGHTGDLFVTRDSPFKGVPLIHPFISYYYGGHAAMLKYEQGQAFFIEATGFPERDETIFDYIFTKYDSKNDLNSTVNKRRGNYWQNPNLVYEPKYYDTFYRDKYIGLRPVNHFANLEDGNLIYQDYIFEAINSAEEKWVNDSLYNFLFFLDMRGKYYCTDLMSRAYDEAYEKVVNNNLNYESKGYAKKMNDDGFITSVNDLILSKDTFIHFYVEIKEELINNEKELVEYIYYLEDVNL